MRYITNDTASPIYVGGKMIPPFSGRHIEDAQLPPELRPAAAPEPEQPGEPTVDGDEPLREALTRSIAQIKPLLPTFTPEQLRRLQALEGEGELPRKTLLEAIDAELLHRADAALQAQEHAERDAALQGAREELLRAKVAQLNLPPGTPEAEREAAAAAVAEAQARVDALVDGA